ncbi:hypothetical protein GCE9029_01813 [Grimontia celer]|uniref:Polysaccharide biosynthesis protein n=1 Tax=Grimontia celer TaxID=1796497 RepID=A0A128EZQ7_9GAMM|nr:hypothetical protein [Grimontia celer]CZF80043.1 hypothetical protein GCE9029_01813 [Grimontia celer]
MLKKILASMANQGAISVFNLIVSIYILKLYSVSDFGVYSIVFALGLGAISFQNALISTPMSVRIKKRVLNGKSKYLNFYNSINLLYLFSILTISIVAGLLIEFPGWLLGLYLVSFSIRDYYKNLLMLDYDVHTVTKMEVLFIFLALLSLLIYYFLEIYSIQLIVITLAICSLISTAVAKCKINIHTNLNILIVYRFYKIKIWPISKWATLGVFVTEIYSRSYIFILTTFYSTEILGLVQAGRVLFGPMNLILNGWIKIARNHLASLLGSNSRDKFGAFIRLSVFGVIALNILAISAVMLFWKHLEELLFIQIEENILLTTVLWGIAVAMIQLRTVISTSLQAYGVFKIQTYFNIMSSITTLLSIILIYKFLSWQYMPLAIAIGEGTLLALSFIYYIKVRKEEYYAS